MPDEFAYDVFLSHSSKDKAVVRAVAERLHADGVKVWFDEWVLKPGDAILSKIDEGLEHSRVVVLCMSAHAFGSDWAGLEYQTRLFRDPLNRERRFLPLRLDDAPLRGSLAQFLYIDWQSKSREQEYAKLLEACGAQKKSKTTENSSKFWSIQGLPVRLRSERKICAYVFSPDGTRALTCEEDRILRIWDLKTGNHTRTLRCHRKHVLHLEWSDDQQRALIWTDDGDVRLIDLVEDKILADYGKTTLSKRQMDCARLLAGGLSAIEIRRYLQLYVLTAETHLQNLRKNLNASTRDDLRSIVTRLYGHGHDSTFPPLKVNHGWLPLLAFTVEVQRALADKEGQYRDFRLCTPFGNGFYVSSEEIEINPLKLAWKSDRRFVAAGLENGIIQLWDALNGTCIRSFEGHTGTIESLAWHPDQRMLLSGASRLAMLWDTETGTYEATFNLEHPISRVAWTADGSCVILGDREGQVHILNLSKYNSEVTPIAASSNRSLIQSEQIQYTNAKVLLVGDTNSGKTGLTHCLATGKWQTSDASTVGAWSTQWPLKDSSAGPGVDREIWLWDFGGQADQRLVHQLFMDRTALILLLFNADQEDVLSGLRDWQTALRRCVKEPVPIFLVAGRIDTGFKASRGKLQAFAQAEALAYYETSAKEGTGCDALRAAITSAIPWDTMTKRTSPRTFKLIKDEILKLRDEGQVLHTFKELRELLWQRLPDEPRFTDETLQTVIGLLDGPGAVKEFDYGTYVLLAPEWVNAYAQAVIRTLRAAEHELGALPLRGIAEGNLIYQSVGRDGSAVEMKRLPRAEEKVILNEMERQLEERGLCLRQGDKLVFPSHCGRERPEVREHPEVFISYAVKGFLDDIYATLAVKLLDSQSFKLQELWRDAADFVTLAGDGHMGIKLTRESASDGSISVYFGKGVTGREQVIFANYIHAHLRGACEQAARLRHYTCPDCFTSKGNPEALMKRLLRDGQTADTECDNCGRRFPLWDPLEKLFASEDVRAKVERLQSADLAQLTTRRKGKLLVLDVGARITSANQKWLEVPGDEDDGIDMIVEFTDDDGNGIGQGLCLQLKAGNSFLTKRRRDGAEIFTIKKPRWVQTWTHQPYPVMLVIGTFPPEDARRPEKQKVEFADVRWMEITSVLQRESANGTKPVTQIEFKGERLDLSSVRRWRDKIVGQGGGAT